MSIESVILYSGSLVKKNYIRKYARYIHTWRLNIQSLILSDIFTENIKNINAKYNQILLNRFAS